MCRLLGSVLIFAAGMSYPLPAAELPVLWGSTALCLWAQLDKRWSGKDMPPPALSSKENSFFIDYTACNMFCEWWRESCNWWDSPTFTGHVRGSVINERTFHNEGGGGGRRHVPIGSTLVQLNLETHRALDVQRQEDDRVDLQWRFLQNPAAWTSWDILHYR